ncbi:MAG: hypothetical protein JO057_16620 [Chloroflexi bacterium]|nr:hypothetical protein [Chloroflexota bacterium]
MSTSIEGETLHCARHPHTETVLRCGRCDTPICARCMVMSPVGARCPTCAQVKRFVIGLKPAEMAKAIVFGIGLGAVGTIILTFIPFLGIFGYAALGFGVGEVVSIGANRKRVPSLAPIAVACLFVGYWVGTVALLVFNGNLLSIELFIVPLILLFRGLSIAGIASSPLIGLLIGALLAWMRVR